MNRARTAGAHTGRADRFAAELAAHQRRGSRLVRWFVRLEAVLALVLLVSAAFVIAQMVGDIASGRLISFSTGQLWLWAAPIFALLCLLALLLARRLSVYWAGRVRLGRSDLRNRLAQTFAFVGIVPTALILTLAVIYFSIGFSGWIKQTFDRVLADQTALADGYAKDLKNRVEEDLGNMAQSLAGLFETGAGLGNVQRFMQQRADIGGYWQLYLYDATGTPSLRRGPGQAFDPILPGNSFREAAQSVNGRLNLSLEQDFGQVKVLAVVPNTVPPLFLYGAQLVDSAYKESAASARQARLDLANIEGRLRLTFFLATAVLVLVALVLLFSATAVGLWFANRLLEPIGNIIAAAADIGEGSLDVRVPVSQRQFAEFQALTDSFNVMAGRLEQQQADLRAANVQIAARGQFTTAVLTGVSAGVVGLSADYQISLPNKSAGDLLGLDLQAYMDFDIRLLIPEFAPLLDQAGDTGTLVRSQEVKVFHKTTGSLLILLASAIAERVDDKIIGYVLTFDDISALASAQRQSAWAEVARRIAHEIKNPLTPIQLSTERLRRRFTGQIDGGEDQEVFNLCLDTISKQVETIARLVNEFASFSRMPTASLAAMDLGQVCRQAHFLQAARFEEQDWTAEIPEVPVLINGDQNLLNQAIQNLLKNAAEAAQEVHAGSAAKVMLKLWTLDDGQTQLTITDNGKGFAEALLPKLGEPYVSTKQQGTGLGLAIVKKIMEDHAGIFSPANSPEGGGVISLTFPAFDATRKIKQQNL